ncbi:hypothetical protein GXN76_11115 [Kroppenstedtia pulmonis]|uniref:Uncharacterized protein n=1 Tax=Kroppenstedtia pulmonis TaxID=1380685 RepID=A0A7D3XJ73_9BACL|nr:hypothetical protein [Kroppenstedtia pulmonis]QKG84964.1 hypothetical protein GXN76_11115 [Kroppenstedtia pulmonis]
MSNDRILKWITGGMEALLGIPFLGGIIVLSSSYSVLGLMLILHIVTLSVSIHMKGARIGSIVGIVTSCIAWIPFIGMIMHIISAILLMVTAAGGRKREEWRP